MSQSESHVYGQSLGDLVTIRMKLTIHCPMPIKFSHNWRKETEYMQEISLEVGWFFCRGIAKSGSIFLENLSLALAKMLLLWSKVLSLAWQSISACYLDIPSPPNPEVTFQTYRGPAGFGWDPVFRSHQLHINSRTRSSSIKCFADSLEDSVSVS